LSASATAAVADADRRSGAEEEEAEGAEEEEAGEEGEGGEGGSDMGEPFGDADGALPAVT
ncbi:hypothetical protein, partial [Streptomyces corynorhini]